MVVCCVVACGLLVVVCCLWFVDCRVLFVICYLLCFVGVGVQISFVCCVLFVVFVSSFFLFVFVRRCQSAVGSCLFSGC